MENTLTNQTSFKKIEVNEFAVKLFLNNIKSYVTIAKSIGYSSKFLEDIQESAVKLFYPEGEVNNG